MSLSLHSSTDALTSSKRGLEKDKDMDPEKSSMGEISFRISSRPPVVMASVARSRQRSLPTSQSKESTWRARRFGTSRGSRIFAKETRGGAPGIPFGVAEGVLPGRETAKMRPSEAMRRRYLRSPEPPRPHGGRGSRRAAQTSSVAGSATAVESASLGHALVSSE